MPLPPASKLVLTDPERSELQTISRHRSTPRGIVLRINIILGAAEGTANHVLARNLSTSVPTVLLWRKRYESDGLAGVTRGPTPKWTPQADSPEKEAAIVEATIKTTPKDATHWSVRTMAASQKVSPATVQRIWKKHKLQPHRVESFKFSTDPEFAPKVRDIVGLYMNPPDKAIVLSVDEKSQIQALDRTQPILAAAARTARAANARLRAAWNNHAVCRPECSGRNRHRRMPAETSASGVPRFPGAD